MSNRTTLFRNLLLRVIAGALLITSSFGCPRTPNTTKAVEASANTQTQRVYETQPLAKANSPEREPTKPPTATASKASAFHPEPAALLLARDEFAVDADAIRSGVVERYKLQNLEDPEKETAYLLDRYNGGDSSVALDLALLLAYVDSSPDQFDQAKAILKLAAENGEPTAYSELARLVLLGGDGRFSASEFANYLEQAVNARDPEGIYLLGVANRLDLIPGADLKVGFELLETAAQQGVSNAAKSIFETLSQTAYSVEGSKTERKSILQSLLKSYPDMEEWLLAATKNGTPSDFAGLAAYYDTVQQEDRAREVRLTAAQLGSFDALSRVLRSDSRVMTDAVYRESIMKLLQVHIDNAPAVAGEANFLMASFTVFGGTDSDSVSQAERYLKLSLQNHNYRAGIALLEIQRGTNPYDAFQASFAVDHEDVYSRYQELERKISGNGQSDHAPYAKRLAHEVYPPELKAEGISGRVVVEATIDEQGNVVAPRVVESSHPAFNSYAIEMIEASEFEPALHNGKPIAKRIRFPFIFTPPE